LLKIQREKMKKLLSSLVTGILVAGCGTSIAGNGNTPTKFANSAAVLLTASVNITGTGLDTPPASEINENVNKISSAVVSVFNADSKLTDTIKLKKIEASTKGEISKFSSGYIALPSGSAKLKFDFNDSGDKSLFSTEGKVDLKAKTVFDITGDLSQVGKSKEPNPVESLKVDINERKDFASGELNAALKGDLKEDNLKPLLEENGIKVTSFKKIFTGTYNVKFSWPSVAEALILANQTGKFEYAEPNGSVSLQ
jgi:hypothetical protein